MNWVDRGTSRNIGGGFFCSKIIVVYGEVISDMSLHCYHLCGYGGMATPIEELRDVWWPIEGLGCFYLFVSHNVLLFLALVWTGSPNESEVYEHIIPFLQFPHAGRGPILFRSLVPDSITI